MSPDETNFSSDSSYGNLTPFVPGWGSESTRRALPTSLVKSRLVPGVHSGSCCTQGIISFRDLLTYLGRILLGKEQESPGRSETGVELRPPALTLSPIPSSGPKRVPGCLHWPCPGITLREWFQVTPSFRTSCVPSPPYVASGQACYFSSDEP